jgi:MoaA/NifB/PqqE/SkfB family radical SAM enzyme
MDRLTFEEAKKVVFQVENAAPIYDAANPLTIDVCVKNNTSVVLDSLGDTPLHFSYRWLNTDQTLIVQEGERTRFTNPLPVHAEKKYTLQISPPSPDEGVFILRLTLVQENVQWFDQPEIDVKIDLTVELQRDLWRRAIIRDDNYILGYLPNCMPRQQGESYIPFALHITTVSDCSLHCLVCPYDQLSFQTKVMDMVLFEKIIADYIELGGGDVILTPTVGEVMLDPLLSDRVQLLSQKNEINRIEFATAAIYKDQYTHQQLDTILANTNHLRFSVYGLNEYEYAQMTGKSGLYDSCVSNIRNIININDHPNITFDFFLLHDYTRFELENWMYRNFNKCFPFQYILEYGNWGGLMDTKTKLPFSAKWLDAKNDRPKNDCLYPRVHMWVGVDGDVEYCGYGVGSNEENILGNLKNQKLSDIYKNPATQSKQRLGISGCSACTHYRSINLLNNKEG